MQLDTIKFVVVVIFVLIVLSRKAISKNILKSAISEYVGKAFPLSIPMSQQYFKGYDRCRTTTIPS